MVPERTFAVLVSLRGVARSNLGRGWPLQQPLVTPCGVGLPAPASWRVLPDRAPSGTRCLAWKDPCSFLLIHDEPWHWNSCYHMFPYFSKPTSKNVSSKSKNPIRICLFWCGQILWRSSCFFSGGRVATTTQVASASYWKDPTGAASRNLWRGRLSPSQWLPWTKLTPATKTRRRHQPASAPATKTSRRHQPASGDLVRPTAAAGCCGDNSQHWKQAGIPALGPICVECSRCGQAPSPLQCLSRAIGLHRQHLTVQRCDVADYLQKESCSVVHGFFHIISLASLPPFPHSLMRLQPFMALSKAVL